ncbi:MAG: hypothetical protein DRP03_01040 [Candidatus Aenigmatarchaeota archaeon]|nr:MAG: hypothetical protein DRP03_01040 [Candidatus Aenigmarchaeota archaeon]
MIGIGELYEAFMQIYSIYGMMKSVSSISGTISELKKFDAENPACDGKKDLNYIKRYGFLYTPRFGENPATNDFKEYVKDGGMPDIWSVSGFPGAGEMVIASKNGFGRINGIEDAKFYLKMAPSPYYVDIEFDTDIESDYPSKRLYANKTREEYCELYPRDEVCDSEHEYVKWVAPGSFSKRRIKYNISKEIDRFIVTLPDGTKYVYGDPRIKGAVNYEHLTTEWIFLYHKFGLTGLINIEFKKFIPQAYPYAWKLTAILGPDYVDGGGDPYNPLDDGAEGKNNKGGWIAFRYERTVPLNLGHYYYDDSGNCVELQHSCGFYYGMNTSRIVKKDYYKDGSKKYHLKLLKNSFRDISYLSKIITPVYEAEFIRNFYGRKDEKEIWRILPEGVPDSYGCKEVGGVFYDWVSAYDRLSVLKEIVLKSRITGKPVKIVRFNSGIDSDEMYELAPGYSFNEIWGEEYGKYTLKNIEICDGSGRNCLPKMEFYYDINPPYDKSKIDSFGMYCPGCTKDNYNGPTDKQTKFSNLYSKYCFDRTIDEDDSLVASYHLNEGSGNKVGDSSKYGNDGNIFTSGGNAKWVNGYCKAGLKFENINPTEGYYAYITVSPTSMYLRNNVTFEAWVNPDKISKGGIIYRVEENKGVVITEASNYSLYMDENGKIVFEICYKQEWDTGKAIRCGSITSSESLQPHKWYYIVAIYNGSNMRLYINSKLVGEKRVAAPIIPRYSGLNGKNSGLTIGLFDATPEIVGDEYNFIGTIDEVRIYNRSLSDEEIKEHYSADLSSAWMLSRVKLPSGAEIKWEYEIDKWFTSKGDGPLENYYAELRDESIPYSDNYGGGVRVKRMIVCDGLHTSLNDKDHCHYETYDYRQFYQFGKGTYTRSSGVLDLVPLSQTTDKNERDLRKTEHQATSYLTGGVMYNRVCVFKDAEVPESYDMINPTDYPNGYECYYYLTTESTPESTGHATNEKTANGLLQRFEEGDAEPEDSPKLLSQTTDYSWKRGQNYKVEYYSSNKSEGLDGLLMTFERKYEMKEHFKVYYGGGELAGAKIGTKDGDYLDGFSSGWSRMRSMITTIYDGRDMVKIHKYSGYDEFTGLPRFIIEEGNDKFKVSTMDYVYNYYPEMLSKHIISPISNATTYEVDRNVYESNICPHNCGCINGYCRMYIDGECSTTPSKELDFCIEDDNGVGHYLMLNMNYRRPIAITGLEEDLDNYQLLIENPVYDETGLVGAWSFEKIKEGKVYDSSGFMNDGTIVNNVKTVEGVFNSALLFEGNGHLEIPYSDSLNVSNYDGLSVEMWIKPNSYNEGTFSYIFILGKKSKEEDLFIYKVYITRYSELMFGVTTETETSRGTQHFFYGVTAPITLNKWHHVVGTYNKSTRKVKLYIDGNFVGSRDVETGNLLEDVGAGEASLVIGKDPRKYIKDYNGSIDEVKIYKRELTQEEIRQRFEAKLKPNYADIRFTDEQGKELPYWMESYGKFWVRVPHIPANGETKIYVYYGNRKASSASDGTQVFDKVGSFDNFKQGWDATLPSGGCKTKLEDSALTSFEKPSGYNWKGRGVDISTDYVDEGEATWFVWFVRKEFVAPNEFELIFSTIADDDEAWTAIYSTNVTYIIGGNVGDCDGTGSHSNPKKYKAIIPEGRFIFAGRGHNGKDYAYLQITDVSKGLDKLYTRKIVKKEVLVRGSGGTADRLEKVEARPSYTIGEEEALDPFEKWKALKSMVTEYKSFGGRIYPYKIKQWYDTNKNGKIDAGDEYVVKKTLEYDSYGNIIKSTDGEGKSEYTRYDNEYGVMPIKGWNDEYGSEAEPAWQKVYDGTSLLPIKLINENGQETRYEYDNFWRLSKVWFPGDDTSKPSLIYEYTFNPDGEFPISLTLKKKIDNTRYYTERVYYDGLNRKIKSVVHSSDGNIVSYDVILGSRGLIKRRYKPYFEEEGRGAYIEYEYYPNPLARLKAAKTYDKDGNLLGTIKYYYGIKDGMLYVTTEDEEGNQIRHLFDKLTRLVKVEEGRWKE